MAGVLQLKFTDEFSNSDDQVFNMKVLHPTQAQKAKTFRDLHEAKECFIAPNPWDAGSTKILTDLGFKALASTGAGFAFSRGLPDNGISRDMLFEHLREICSATHVPVTADLENGFGDSPESVAETFSLVEHLGIVGGSIEDSTRVAQKPIYDIKHSVERVKAAVIEVRKFHFPFLLTARAENYFVGNPDLADTIERLQAYEDAGADVLFAPGIKDASDLATVLKEINKPLNVLIGVPGMTIGFRELKDLGVTRVSVGGSLARLAIAALYRGATELINDGTAQYTTEATSGKHLNSLFQ